MTADLIQKLRELQRVIANNGIARLPDSETVRQAADALERMPAPAEGYVENGAVFAEAAALFLKIDALLKPHGWPAQKMLRDYVELVKRALAAANVQPKGTEPYGWVYELWVEGQLTNLSSIYAKPKAVNDPFGVAGMDHGGEVREVVLYTHPPVDGRHQRLQEMRNRVMLALESNASADAEAWAEEVASSLLPNVYDLLLLLGMAQPMHTALTDTEARNLIPFQSVSSDWYMTGFRAAERYYTGATQAPAPVDEAGRAKLVAELMMMVGRYWDIAYVEGKEGRLHDTPAGDAQRALSAIYEAAKHLAGLTPCAAVVADVPAGMVLVPLEPTKEMLATAGPGTYWIAEAKKTWAGMVAAAPKVHHED